MKHSYFDCIMSELNLIRVLVVVKQNNAPYRIHCDLGRLYSREEGAERFVREFLHICLARKR